MFVAINTTQQYNAAVVDQFGNSITSAQVVYSISSGGGTISSSGLFTAPATTGSTTITATSGSSSASATVTITPPNQAPTVATAASASPNPVTSTTTTLSVFGADDNGEANLTYTWALVGTPPATVSYSINGNNAAKTTVATFTANGSYNFLVTIKDSGGLTTTSSVTVTVNIFVPIVLDGNLDGRYGTPITTSTATTNVGSNGTSGVLGSGTKTAYTQLVAGYGVIDQSNGTFNLFLAGSLSLNNQHLNILIDSVTGQGAANLDALQNVGPYNNGSGFAYSTLDSTFRPDSIFTFAYGAGTSLNYYNFDSGATGNNNLSDPSTTTVTSSGSVPLFSERVNNAAVGAAVSPANAASLATGAEFSFNLAGLGYTAADYAAGDAIGVMAIVTYGSFTQFSNQVLAPLNSTAAETAANSGSYFGNSTSSSTDFSNAAYFPGNQFFSVPVPAAASGPTIATAASANPSPVVNANTTALSVLGADSSGESTLTYTWSTTGTPPAPVSFSVNGTNAAKNTTATFAASGTYNFLVTATDPSNATTTSTVTVTVTVPAAKAKTSTSLVNNGSGTSNASQALSYTATVSGGVPAGETVTLEDAANNNAVVATAGTTSGGVAAFAVPAGTLAAGTHSLFAVYGGDGNFAPSQSAALVQTVQVVVTGVVVNGNLAALAGTQRSMVNDIVYSFSEAVNLGANAFVIAVHGGYPGTLPTLAWAAVNPGPDGSATQWAVTFTGGSVVGGSVANGVYDITLNAAAAASDATPAAPAVASQSRGTDTFWRLYGDFAGNGYVSGADYNAFLSTYNLKSTQSGYLAAFDATGTNARISNADYVFFNSDYGTRYKNVTAVSTI